MSSRCIYIIHANIGEALDDDNGPLFASLLKEFEMAIRAQWTRDKIAYYLSQLVFRALDHKKSPRMQCVHVLWHCDPEQFSRDKWFLLMQRGSVADIQTIFNLNREAAYMTLSLLGANPTILPRKLIGTSNVIDKITMDQTKLDWLRHIGIHIEWPYEVKK
jgi:hypothetical protein